MFFCLLFVVFASGVRKKKINDLGVREMKKFEKHCSKLKEIFTKCS